NQVDSTIDLAIPNFRVICDAGLPFRLIISNQIVALAGKRINSFDPHMWCRAHPSHPQIEIGLTPVHLESGFGLGERQAVSAASRGELHPRIELSLVRFKTQW